MDAPGIVFLDRATLAAHLELPRPALEHQWVEYQDCTPEEIVARLANAQVAVVNKVRLKASMLKQLPGLRLISLVATGFDNIDTNHCKQAGIAVANVRNYAAATLAEHCLGLMLALSRNLLTYHRSVGEGRWSRNAQFCYFDYPIHDLAGETLVIIGKGSLGSAVARTAQALGMRVLFAEHRDATQPRPGYTPFYQALEQARVISLHCPLNAATSRLLDARAFAAMRKKLLLINTARGGLIDEDALIEALEQGRIGGAALDVLASEPPPADSRLIALSRTLPNLLITPHIAWASDKGQLAAWQQAMENIQAFYRGEQLRRLV